MNRFHPKLHELVLERFKELGVEVILNDRVKIPEGGFPSDGSTFDVELSSGRKVPADFVVSLNLHSRFLSIFLISPPHLTVL